MQNTLENNTKTLTLKIYNDSDCECPIGESGDESERILLFRKGSTFYADIYDYFHVNEDKEVVPDTIRLQRQLDCETAFVVSCYEHGAVHYSLQGEGSSCPWDSTSFAGIYWLPSDVTPERRKSYARGMMESFTDWCNGNCFGYVLEDESGEEIDSCWGFIGDDHIIDVLKNDTLPHLKEIGYVLESIEDGDETGLPYNIEYKLQEFMSPK